MKHCPKCSLAYSDDILEFCLEDGLHLTLVNKFEAEMPTVTLSDKSNSQAKKNIKFTFFKYAQNV
jgi:hypothetical protein